MSVALSGASPEAPVSAVIACYQSHETIARAVASVAAQSARPMELIVVDDASDRTTQEALHALRERHGTAWLKVLRLEQNRGPAAARNVGWEAAKQPYVAFLDADDTWLPHKIERQCAFFEMHPEFAVVGHLSDYLKISPKTDQRRKGPQFREISRLRVLIGNPMTTPSLMVRRIGTPRFDGSLRHMEDHRFLQTCVFGGVRVARIEQVLVLIHKDAYGAGGLSGDLAAMEKGELENYRALHRAGAIGAPVLGLLTAWSLAKYARRLGIVALRRLSA